MVNGYTKEAIIKYRDKKDVLTIYLNKGTKDSIISKYGTTNYSNYIQRLIDRDLLDTSEELPF